MSVWQSVCEKLGLVLCEVWSGLPSVGRGGVRVVSRKESDKERVVVKKPELESWVCDVMSGSHLPLPALQAGYLYLFAVLPTIQSRLSM